MANRSVLLVSHSPCFGGVLLQPKHLPQLGLCGSKFGINPKSNVSSWLIIYSRGKYHNWLEDLCLLIYNYWVVSYVRSKILMGKRHLSSWHSSLAWLLSLKRRLQRGEKQPICEPWLCSSNFSARYDRKANDWISGEISRVLEGSLFPTKEQGREARRSFKAYHSHLHSLGHSCLSSWLSCH